MCSWKSLIAFVCLDCSFGRNLHFTGITSSMPEDELAAVTLLAVFFIFREFLSFQDKSVHPCGFHIRLRL
jgi:hypothetical protein